MDLKETLNEVLSEFKSMQLDVSETCLKINLLRNGKNKMDQTPIEIIERLDGSSHSQEKVLELSMIQCTAPVKSLNILSKKFHSYIFIKRDEVWYCCNDTKIKSISFEQVKMQAASHAMHLFYAPAKKIK